MIGFFFIGLLIVVISVPMVLYFFLLTIGSVMFGGVLAMIKRQCAWPEEYRADKFAHDLGFGEGLISYLERIEDEDVRSFSPAEQKDIYPYPPTALRIERLEG